MGRYAVVFLDDQFPRAGRAGIWMSFEVRIAYIRSSWARAFSNEVDKMVFERMLACNAHIYKVVLEAVEISLKAQMSSEKNLYRSCGFFRVASGNEQS